MSEEVIAPMREEFLYYLKSIRVSELVSNILSEVGNFTSDMKMSELARVRQVLNEQPGRVLKIQETLNKLSNEFHFSRESGLGKRIREIILSLADFEKKLQALDTAISQTDIQLMAEVVNDLKEVQLAVLRVEDMVMAMDESH